VVTGGGAVVSAVAGLKVWGEVGSGSFPVGIVVVERAEPGDSPGDTVSSTPPADPRISVQPEARQSEKERITIRKRIGDLIKMDCWA
jgi:hypothetical protein